MRQDAGVLRQVLGEVPRVLLAGVGQAGVLVARLCHAHQAHRSAQPVHGPPGGHGGWDRGAQVCAPQR